MTDSSKKGGGGKRSDRPDDSGMLPSSGSPDGAGPDSGAIFRTDPMLLRDTGRKQVGGDDSADDELHEAGSTAMFDPMNFPDEGSSDPSDEGADGDDDEEDDEDSGFELDLEDWSIQEFEESGSAPAAPAAKPPAPKPPAPKPPAPKPTSAKSQAPEAPAPKPPAPKPPAAKPPAAKPPAPSPPVAKAPPPPPAPLPTDRADDDADDLIILDDDHTGGDEPRQSTRMFDPIFTPEEIEAATEVGTTADVPPPPPPPNVPAPPARRSEADELFGGAAAKSSPGSPPPAKTAQPQAARKPPPAKQAEVRKSAAVIRPSGPAAPPTGKGPIEIEPGAPGSDLLAGASTLGDEPSTEPVMRRPPERRPVPPIPPPPAPPPPPPEDPGDKPTAVTLIRPADPGDNPTAATLIRPGIIGPGRESAGSTTTAAEGSDAGAISTARADEFDEPFSLKPETTDPTDPSSGSVGGRRASLLIKLCLVAGSLALGGGIGLLAFPYYGPGIDAHRPVAVRSVTTEADKLPRGLEPPAGLRWRIRGDLVIGDDGRGRIRYAYDRSRAAAIPSDISLGPEGDPAAVAAWEDFVGGGWRMAFWNSAQRRILIQSPGQGRGEVLGMDIGQPLFPPVVLIDWLTRAEPWVIVPADRGERSALIVIDTADAELPPAIQDFPFRPLSAPVAFHDGDAAGLLLIAPSETAPAEAFEIRIYRVRQDGSFHEAGNRVELQGRPLQLVGASFAGSDGWYVITSHASRVGVDAVRLEGAGLRRVGDAGVSLHARYSPATEPETFAAISHPHPRTAGSDVLMLARAESSGAPSAACIVYSSPAGDWQVDRDLPLPTFVPELTAADLNEDGYQEIIGIGPDGRPWVMNGLTREVPDGALTAGSPSAPASRIVWDARPAAEPGGGGAIEAFYFSDRGTPTRVKIPLEDERALRWFMIRTLRGRGLEPMSRAGGGS